MAKNSESIAHSATDSTTWLRRAILAAASLTGERMAIPGSEGWSDLPTATAGRLQTHPTYPNHSHAFDEMCLAIGGTAGIWVGDKCYRMESPRLLVLEARVVHGEAQYEQHPHELMWMGLASDSAAYLSFSSFSPKIGWQTYQGPRISRLNCSRLLERFKGRQETLNPEFWPMIQNELLDALVSLQAEKLNADAMKTPGTTRDHSSIVDDIQQYLLSRLAEPLSLDDVARLVQLNANYVNQLFRRHTGLTTYAWLLEQRMKKSMSLCQETELPIKRIAQEVGFTDALYFSKAFRRRFGLAPSDARTRDVDADAKKAVKSK